MLILNDAGKQLDALHYSDDWHFSLLEEKEGVSLERLSTEEKTQDQSNWHSASAAVQFATPGERNSQSPAMEREAEGFQLESKWMSPNNDGVNDLLVMRYRFDAPGNVVQAMVFDAAGRMKGKIVRSELCGTTGLFFWDGFTDNNEKIKAGAYILYVEIFNKSGKVNRIKRAFYVEE